MTSPSHAEIQRLWSEGLGVLHSLHQEAMQSWLDLDLTMPQLKVLLIVDSEGSATVTGLAAKLGVAPPTITGIVDRLVQRGLIDRHGDLNDRRVVHEVLTGQGREVVQRLLQTQRERFSQVLEYMTEEDIQALSRGLEAVRRASQHMLEEG
jgi:DNA-binding MarR family transcriptional regulator